MVPRNDLVQSLGHVLPHPAPAGVVLAFPKRQGEMAGSSVISCSHWGLYPISYTLDGLLDGMSEKNIHPEIPTSMPHWWAGSAAYQHLNFGPYLS